MNYKPADPRFKQVFSTLIKIFQSVQVPEDMAERSAFEDDLIEEASSYFRDDSISRCQSAIYEAVGGRRFGITAAGRLCLLPPFTQVGDAIFVPFGSQAPFVIRESPCNKQSPCSEWKIVGDTFVEGVMNGEAIGSEPSVGLVFG